MADGEVPVHADFAWDKCVPLFVHPIKVAAIEALLWIEEPIAPKQLVEMLEEDLGVSVVAYHFRSLADLGLVEQDHQSPVRGALQTFYRLSRSWRSES
jgi:DNA-binding transcriptional ArsR family regulator